MSGAQACQDDFKPYGSGLAPDGYRLFLTWIREKNYGKDDKIQCRFAALAPDGELHIAGGMTSDEERGDILHAITKLLQTALTAAEEDGE